MISAIGAFTNSYATSMRIDAGNRILANNNAMMQNVASASRQAMAFGSAGIPAQSLNALHQQEKILMATTLRNRFLYIIGLKQEEEAKDKEKKKLDYKA